MVTDREKTEQQRDERAAERPAGRFGWSDACGPGDDEVEAWALAEKKRREAWLAGPTEEEKRLWARGERWRRTTGAGFEVTDRTRQLFREAELAGMGLLYAITWAPFAAVSELMRLGTQWEEGYASPHRPRRVRFDSDPT